MPNTHPNTLYAVDIGNSRVKIGQFDDGGDILMPVRTLDLGADVIHSDDALAAALEAWLGDDSASNAKTCSDATPTWWIGTVNWPLAARLSTQITNLAAGEIHRLSHSDLPIEVRVDAPDRVGVDRLLAAVGANRLRSNDRPAIVVDLGTAITVDLVATDGAFEGGAILPGIAMAAQAMAERTDALPRSPLTDLVDPPPPIGKSTLAALESGLYWGALGAIRELVHLYAAQTTDAPSPELFLTGGAAPQVAALLTLGGEPARHAPHLVLLGVATAARDGKT